MYNMTTDYNNFVAGVKEVAQPISIVEANPAWLYNKKTWRSWSTLIIATFFAFGNK